MEESNIYFIYKYEWPDGCVYIGQSNSTQHRFGNEEAYRNNKALYSKMKSDPNYTKEIVENFLSGKLASTKEVYWIGYYHAYHDDNKLKGLNFTLSECGAKTHNSKYSNTKINQYTKEGKYIKTFDSIATCSVETGIQYHYIYAAIKANSLYNKMYYFRIYDDNTDDIEVDNKPRGRSAKSVVQYTKEGVEVKQWDSIREASKALKIAKTHISACCVGKIKSIGGYVWRYKEGEDNETI